MRHSLSLLLSHFLFITVTLSVSSFLPILPHTIPLLFSIQVRSFTGSPFSDEFDEDNQIAKFDTIAYGIWKTKSSYVHLQSCYLTLRPCISSLIFLPLSLVLFISLSISLRCDLIVSLPLSFSWCLSHTLFLCTFLKPLSLSIFISCSISLLLSVSLLFCYCFSISTTLNHSQSLWRNLWAYFTLSLRHYSSPFSIPIMIWLSLILICFCFNNNYFFACLVACLYED